jgi:hypothetical protein
MTDRIKITGACLRTPEMAHYLAISESRLTLRMSAPGGWRRATALELALGRFLQCTLQSWALPRE